MKNSTTSFTSYQKLDNVSALRHLWLTLMKSNYLIGFIATASVSIGGFMMMPFASAFAINNLQITKDQLPIIFMLSGLVSLAIMPIIGKLSDKVNKFKLFVIASSWTIIVIILYTNFQ